MGFLFPRKLEMLCGSFRDCYSRFPFSACFFRFLIDLFTWNDVWIDQEADPGDHDKKSRGEVVSDNVERHFPV